MYFSTQYASPLGELTLCGREDKLAGLWLAGQKYFGASIPEEPLPRDDLPLFGQVKAWLDRYFAGGRPDPSELPLAPAGTPFRQEVWRQLLRIPYGQTATYGGIAQTIAPRRGKAVSARAVGSAAGHNPISVIIPCHRLVGADGGLTGYAGGLEAKLWLLSHEGAALGRPRSPREVGAGPQQGASNTTGSP